MEAFWTRRALPQSWTLNISTWLTWLHSLHYHHTWLYLQTYCIWKSCRNPERVFFFLVLFNRTLMPGLTVTLSGVHSLNCKSVNNWDVFPRSLKSPGVGGLLRSLFVICQTPFQQLNSTDWGFVGTSTRLGRVRGHNDSTSSMETGQLCQCPLWHHKGHISLSDAFDQATYNDSQLVKDKVFK